VEQSNKDEDGAKKQKDGDVEMNDDAGEDE
jgi:hypothetical protein